MRALLLLLLLFFAVTAIGQNASRYKKPTQNDSILLSTLRNKIIQNINANPDSALVYIKKFENLSIKRNYKSSFADSHYLFAQYFRRIQKPDSAIFYFKKTISTSEKINYFRGLSMGYNGLCRTYYLLGEIENSIDACNKGLKFINKFDDVGNVVLADTHNALAIQQKLILPLGAPWTLRLHQNLL